MQQQTSFLDSLCGKTFPVPLAVTAEQTSKPSSRRLPMLSEMPMILFLDLRWGGGNLLGAYWDTVGALPGVSMTLNTGEFPSEERESTLSQILDLNAPEKYCLSRRACQGILNRAEKRGKELPPMLLDALMERISFCGEMDAEPDEPDYEEETDEEYEDDE